MNNFFDMSNELGPFKIIHIHQPDSGLKAILVIDNVAVGPSIGGIRIASDVTAVEALRLARAMTLKTLQQVYVMEAEKLLSVRTPGYQQKKKNN